MENRVTSEFEKSFEALAEMLRNKHGLNGEAVDAISNSVKDIVMQMIRLMKEGKTAHEKFFSDIILNSVDAIIGFDEDFRIFLWNKGAENIFGYSREEAMGKDFQFLIPGYLLEKGEKTFLIEEVRKKGFIANYETERITKSGETKSVSISRFSIFDEQNKSIGSVGIVRDITLVKKLQQELREKENLALIGEVVSSVAHSLSNPLNIISGNADYLMLNKKPGDDEYEELQAIINETTRITRSIRHLLNFSRPIKSNRKLNDLNEVIQRIALNVKHISGNKDIKIKKEIDDAVGKFEFDAEQIEESILNIVTNAIQAIPSKGEITLAVKRKNGNAVISISDNGLGIPKENIDKIFKPFFSTKEYGKGTGLGLSIVKRVVAEHGGNISVRSIPGKGTAFTIELPA
ncbi:MAG: PAS domain S-box protein [Ignavibacteria bacterium]|nr:PAS domain S-box protein [Ignavibacteria bacterium]